MCRDCGCSNNADIRFDGKQLFQPVTTPPEITLTRSHQAQPKATLSAAQSHAAVHGDTSTELLKLEIDLLAKNNDQAAINRRQLSAAGILSLNMLSSPGSGKTTLLERTIADLGQQAQIFVVEGDQETERDAARIRQAGATAVQVNTGSGCHLEADMLAKAIALLQPSRDAILFIENVGNLVCPALFDLGEGQRVVMLSVTEGDDKPVKYPTMFNRADLVIINKVDLLPYVDFDLQRCVREAQTLNPKAAIIALSASSGEGLQAWYDWLWQQKAALGAAC